MSSSRREFLVRTGSGIAGMMLFDGLARNAQSQPPGPQIRIRKDVTSTAAQADIDAYRTAVGKMKQLSMDEPNNPLGWTKQARIHGNASSFNKCRHGTWFFAPWHRSYLYYFEELIRKFSGKEDFALPYWDWSRTFSIPDSFFGNGNPLNEPSRDVAQGEQIEQGDIDRYVSPTVISRLLNLRDYTSFGGDSTSSGELEDRPHNFIHRWVSGVMVTGESPLDPIFWLHHCNIDRLYSEWLSRPNHSPPVSNTWRNQAFPDFFDRQGQPAGGQFTCQQTLNTDNLSYRYDVRNQPQPLNAPIAWERLSEIASSQSSATAGSVAFALKPSSIADVSKSINQAVRRTKDRVILLRLLGVKPPSDQDVSVSVFINCKNPTPETPITDPSYVGSFTFFAAPHANGEHADDHDHTNNIVLDASSAFDTLYGDTQVPNDEIKVSLVTSRLFKRKGRIAAVSPTEVKPQSVKLEVVGATAM
jgi:hypothetical protein